MTRSGNGGKEWHTDPPRSVNLPRLPGTPIGESTMNTTSRLLLAAVCAALVWMELGCERRADTAASESNAAAGAPARVTADAPKIGRGCAVPGAAFRGATGAPIRRKRAACSAGGRICCGTSWIRTTRRSELIPRVGRPPAREPYSRGTIVDGKRLSKREDSCAMKTFLFRGKKAPGLTI